MTALLYVQGLEFDVTVCDWEPFRLGEVKRSMNGAARSSVRGTKRDHRFSGDVAGVSIATAEAYRHLVEGDGHYWSFDGAELYSSRGLLPSVIVDVGIEPGGVAGKHGQALIAQNGSHLEWPVAFGGTWTLLYWRFESGAFVHYTVRKTAGDAATEVWSNDDKTDVDPGVLTIDGDGNLVFQADDEEVIDDLVALPFGIPDAWQDPLREDRTLAPWAPLPFVTASGAAFPGGPVRCLGLMGPAHRVPLREDGVFIVNEVLDFTLQER